jgi:tRNA A37 methylthiotransferase MiaB
VVGEAAWLGMQDVREIVLVSENSTSYGKDLPGGGSALARLLPRLASVPGSDGVGVFGYSDEDGTEAAGYDGKLDAEVVAARVSRISSLVDELMAQRAEDRVGTEVEVLIEAAEDEDMECTGRAAHQAPEVDGECVLERGSGLEVGDLVRAVVVGTEGADLIVSPRELIQPSKLVPATAGTAR